VSPVTGSDNMMREDNTVGAAMRRIRWGRGALVFGLAGALVGVVPSRVPAAPARSRCRPFAFVANRLSGTVSAIDVKTRRKNPTDIAVGFLPFTVAATPDGKTVFVTNAGSDTVSTVDVKTRKKDPTDIPVGPFPFGMAITPDGKTAFVANNGSGTVSTIDVKTRTKHPNDIPVGANPKGVAITPDGKTAFVTNSAFISQVAPSGDSVSTIDVKTRTKDPTDIAVGSLPWWEAVTPDGKTDFVSNVVGGALSTIEVKTRTKHPTDTPVGFLPYEVAVTPDGKTAFVTNNGGDSVSTIDVKTRTKDPADIPVGTAPVGVAFTPDGKTAFVTNSGGILGTEGMPGTVSTIDVKARSKSPTDIPVGSSPYGVAVTPCRR
jgi:YVTN family beta-propeller protein